MKIFPVPSRFRVSTRRGRKGPALALAGLALICFTFILHSFNLGTFPSRIHRLQWPGLAWPGRCQNLHLQLQASLLGRRAEDTNGEKKEEKKKVLSLLLRDARRVVSCRVVSPRPLPCCGLSRTNPQRRSMERSGNRMNGLAARRRTGQAGAERRRGSQLQPMLYTCCNGKHQRRRP